MVYRDFKDLSRRRAADKHLILLKTQNMMYINAGLLHWFINFLKKSLLVVMLKVKLCQTCN